MGEPTLSLPAGWRCSAAHHRWTVRELTWLERRGGAHTARLPAVPPAAARAPATAGGDQGAVRAAVMAAAATTQQPALSGRVHSRGTGHSMRLSQGEVLPRYRFSATGELG